MLTGYQHRKSLGSMKQLEFDFEALPEVVKEEEKVVTVSRMSYEEVRECWRMEQDYCKGGRAYWLDEQLVREEQAEAKRRKEAARWENMQCT